VFLFLLDTSPVQMASAHVLNFRIPAKCGGVSPCAASRDLWIRTSAYVERFFDCLFSFLKYYCIHQGDLRLKRGSCTRVQGYMGPGHRAKERPTFFSHTTRNAKILVFHYIAHIFLRKPHTNISNSLLPPLSLSESLFIVVVEV
jgi:hypothetical protein